MKAIESFRKFANNNEWNFVGFFGTLPQFSSDKKMVFFNKAMKDIWTNERLLNVVEQLIGPNIAGNCVYNIRSKLPNHEPTVVPWHQGNHANYAR